MGFSQNQNSGSSHTGGRTSLSEINVTPFVDVMLVLLIVFMVSAPLMQQGIEVNLPKANAGALPQAEDPVVLSIRADKTLHIDEKAFSVESAEQKLAALAIGKPNIQVVVHADHTVAYGFVAKVMAMVKKAKIHRVGLVTAPE